MDTNKDFDETVSSFSAPARRLVTAKNSAQRVPQSLPSPRSLCLLIFFCLLTNICQHATQRSHNDPPRLPKSLPRSLSDPEARRPPRCRYLSEKAAEDCAFSFPVRGAGGPWVAAGLSSAPSLFPNAQLQNPKLLYSVHLGATPPPPLALAAAGSRPHPISPSRSARPCCGRPSPGLLLRGGLRVDDLRVSLRVSGGFRVLLTLPASQGL